jgi:hypothetical protein
MLNDGGGSYIQLALLLSCTLLLQGAYLCCLSLLFATRLFDCNTRGTEGTRQYRVCG